jgi:CheY-like chemotaxis protein
MNQRLLIVEDELPMRTALKDCLEGEGYRVLTAIDGEAGLERALKEKPRTADVVAAKRHTMHKTTEPPRRNRDVAQMFNLSVSVQIVAGRDDIVERGSVSSVSRSSSPSSC